MTPAPRLLRRSRRRALALVVGGLLLCPASPALAAPPAKHHGAAQKKGKGGKGHDAPRAPKGAAPVRDGGRAATPPAAGAAPSPAERGSPAPLALSLDLHRATLPNGLRVVIDVNHAAPTVGIAVVYDVGTRDEAQGQGGLARLSEQLMREGSRNVLAGEHALLVASRGGSLDSAVGPDRTSYTMVLPASELALGLWLEADRMRGLEVSEAALDRARRAVLDAQRAAAGEPYHAGRSRLEALVYQGYRPYEHGGLDLEGVDLGGVQAFHARHHGPGSAVLAIAGDVDPGGAMAMVRRYFEPIAAGAAAPFVDPALPEQTSPRTAVIKEDPSRAPGLFYGWAIPAAAGAGHPALELAAEILAGGAGSRLHRILVKDRALATSVSASTGQRRGPDLFRLSALLAPTAKLAEVERLIEGEIAALAARGPNDAELGRARRRVEAGLFLGLEGNTARARLLGDEELRSGDARHLAADLARRLAVTGDEIKRAAAHHLAPARRTLVEAAAEDAPPAAKEAPAGPAGEAPPAKAPAHGKAAATHGTHGKGAKKGGAKTPKKKKP